MLPDARRQATNAGAAPDQKRSSVPLPAEPLDGSGLRRRILTRQRTLMKAGWGVALGASFVLMGLLAPFTLGATTADERFVIMLGFAPITVVGFFLIAIFGRSIFTHWRPAHGTPQPSLAAQPPTRSTARRPPTSRVPQSFEYRVIVPVALLGLLAVMIAVVIVVIYGTVVSAAR
jgi:hypothetical protein